MCVFILTISFFSFLILSICLTSYYYLSSPTDWSVLVRLNLETYYGVCSSVEEIVFKVILLVAMKWPNMNYGFRLLIRNQRLEKTFMLLKHRIYKRIYRSHGHIVNFSIFFISFSATARI